jgi:hypothetical protein
MAKLPEFMLRALYVKGSLRREAGGFSFQLKNELGPARIVGARPLQLDRKPIPLEKSQFVHGETSAAFSEVTPDSSVLMRKGEAVVVRVEGVPLSAGRHTLGISVAVKDMGPVTFSVTDEVK